MKQLPIVITFASMGLVVAACSSAAPQQYAEAEFRVQRSVQILVHSLDKATGAKVRVMMNGDDREKEFPVPQEEWGRLREALAHTAPVPPALESSDDPATAELGYFSELVIVGPGGVELTGVPFADRAWMPESRARKMSPERCRSSDVPDWCMPDADCEALQSISPLAQAKAWAERR